MQTERDHLVRIVFPELKERCRKKHVQLIDVDLRWGVTQADAEHGKALDICLDEIDTCRPYFLGLLGHRYGWIPPGQTHSITAQEIYHGVLHANLPKQVVDLRKIIEEKLEGKTLSNEQKNCLVRCYTWEADKGKFLLREDIAPEDAEIIRSVFERYSIYQKDRSFFFFRTESLTRKLANTNTNDFFEQKQEDQGKLAALKNEIADARLPVFQYDNIETFGQHLLDTLWKRIEAEVDQAPAEEKDWLKEQAEFHELFMADRTRRFVGRRGLLDRMHEFCDRNDDPSLLVITGEPGCGKSALMARFTEEVMRIHPDWLIVPHFVGASPASTSLRQMLRRFCLHLSSTAEVSEDIKELLKLFPELLTKASEQRNLLIIIDAVSQLEQSDRAHLMHWLPQTLPANVRFVISTLPGEPRDALLRRRIKPQEETVAGLVAAEIRELVEAYLKEIHHEFPNPQIEDAFYRKVEQGNPLYILVALEELRVFGKFEELSSRINKLPDNIPALFDQVLERIESDFNPALVRDCMSYIACGRHGMTAEELQTLLKSHAPRMDPNAEPPKFPDMLWSRLYRSFSAYLFERSGVIDFFHGQMKEAAGKRYLQEESRGALATHLTLADYFKGLPRSARQIEEMPWQLQQGCAWDRLATLLGDLDFLRALNRSDKHAPQAYWAVIEMESQQRACHTYREALENPRADVPATVLALTVISALGYSHEALVAIEPVTDLLAEQGYTNLAAMGLLGQASLRRIAGQSKLGLSIIDKALRMYRQDGDRRGVISSLQERLKLLGQLGQRDEEIACLDELERLCRESGDSQAMNECAVERASLLADGGQLDEALEMLAQAERTVRELGDLSLLVNCLNVRAGIARKRGSTQEAMALWIEMERLCRESGDSLRLATCLISQSYLLGASPATREKALAKCREAQAIFRLTNRELDLREAQLFEASLTAGVSGMVRLARPAQVAINSLVCLVIIAVGMALGLWNRWLWLLGGPIVLLGAGNLFMGLFPGLLKRNYRLVERLSAEIQEDEVRRRG